MMMNGDTIKIRIGSDNMESMLECHNHDKIMDSLFEEDIDIGENRELGVAIEGYNSFWTWLAKKIGWRL